MATRHARASYAEKKASVKQLMPKDKRQFMAALRKIEAQVKQIDTQVEQIDTQIQDLKTMTRTFSFWIIG